MFIFSLIISVLTPGAMLIFSLLWKDNPPKDINGTAGYKTTMSRKNQDTWEFANRYFCRLSIYSNIPLIILSPAALFFFRKCSDDTLGIVLLVIVGIQLVVLCLPIIPTEIALKKNFDEDGIRKL